MFVVLKLNVLTVRTRHRHNLSWLMEYLLISFCFAFALSLVINAFKLMTGEGMILRWLYLGLERIFRRGKISNFRDERGLLFIAKPIYACVSCMPSLWSLPILIWLDPLQVLFVAVISVPISTLIYDKLYPWVVFHFVNYPCATML